MVRWDNCAYSVFVTANYNPHQERPEGEWRCGYGQMFPSELYLELGEVVGPFLPTFPEREQQVDYPMFQKQVEHFVECV